MLPGRAGRWSDVVVTTKVVLLCMRWRQLPGQESYQGTLDGKDLGCANPCVCCQVSAATTLYDEPSLSLRAHVGE